MSHAAWHTSLAPKVRGTWNLHTALLARGCAPDFLVLTSSLTGSVGQSTEGNYCAANAFLDGFARHRRARGLPATSLALGMIKEVGYLAEHPEIETLLARKGIKALDEEDMLLLFDLAISCQHGGRGDAHMLTGLEGASPENQQFASDARSSILLSAMAARASPSAASAGASTGSPPAVSQAVAAGDKKAAAEALVPLIADKVAGLLLMPPERLDPGTKLADLGIDSMLSVEARQAFFQVLKVDVPLLVMMAGGTSVRSLAEFAAGEMVKAAGG